MGTKPGAERSDAPGTDNDTGMRPNGAREGVDYPVEVDWRNFAGDDGTSPAPRWGA